MLDGAQTGQYGGVVRVFFQSGQNGGLKKVLVSTAAFFDQRV